MSVRAFSAAGPATLAIQICCTWGAQSSTWARENSSPAGDENEVRAAIEGAEKTLVSQLDSLDVEFRYPQVECLGALWPLEVSK